MTSRLVAEDGGAAFRRLYARMADPEAYVPAGGWIEVVRTELRRSAGDRRRYDALIRDAADWSAASAKRFVAVAERADAGGRRLLTRRAALGWAPIGLAAGSWLQWLTSPGSGDLPLFLRILALYASDVGVGHPAAARGSAYLGLLRQLRVSENAVPLARVGLDPRIGDAAFRLPAVLLLMSRQPDEFCPELIGADLCLRAVGLAPPLALVRQESQADWAAIDYSAARGSGRSPTAECLAIAEALARAEPDSAGRVHAAFAWTLTALRDQALALHAELCDSLDPAYDMAELMRLRAREGSVYHGRVLLEDRPVAAWLTDCRRDPYPFLEVLARSRLVRPGRSAASPLITALVGERGPMFRVFSPEDLTIIERWIDSLPGTTPPRTSARAVPGPAAESDRLARLPALLTSAPAPSPGPRDLREAYHLLMARTGSPELREWSLRYVRGWLARTRHRMRPESVPLPSRWRPEGLRPWLQAQHERHDEQFALSADAALPSREAVVDDAVQTAPLTLIDGSWLQGFTDHELASSDIGHSLFETYWDELGNGRPELNHPLIYRVVLRSMDVELPPTASREFARWPGFRDVSFELPVYWLCVGRFPRTFLPEVLGLNVAMELSGVGGSYRRAAIALREYGFDTRFVDLHNTIDNVATGHSAWATDAVDTLMADLPDSSGPGGRAETWERVRTGYRSLSPPTGPAARRAGRRVARRWRPDRAARPTGEGWSGV